jgi:hypothetical protein
MHDDRCRFMSLMFENVLPNPMVAKSRESRENPQKELSLSFLLHIRFRADRLKFVHRSTAEALAPRSTVRDVIPDPPPPPVDRSSFNGGGGPGMMVNKSA